MSARFLREQQASQSGLELQPLLVGADRVADDVALEDGDGDDGSVDQVEAGRG